MLSRVLLAVGATGLAALAGLIAQVDGDTDITATIYHLVAVYLGGALMAVAAFSRALPR